MAQSGHGWGKVTSRWTCQKDWEASQTNGQGHCASPLSSGVIKWGEKDTSHIYLSPLSKEGVSFHVHFSEEVKGGLPYSAIRQSCNSNISSSVFPSTLDKLKYFHIIIIIHFVPTSSVLLIPAGVNRWTIITRALISHHLPFCPSDSNLAPATANGSDPPCLQTALAPNLRSRKVRCRVVSPAVHSLLGLTGHCLSLSHTHTKPSGFRLHNFSHYISYPHTHMLVSLQRVFQLK